MPFTKEVIDFSTLSTDDIKKTLIGLDISLTPDEVLKIQNEMLGRPPRFPNSSCFQSKALNIVAIKVAGLT